MTTKRRSLIGKFLFRWAVSSLGLGFAAWVLGDNLNIQNSLGVMLIAGLLLAAVNTIVKPLVVFITLPALLVTLGLFMIVINGLMVLLASKLYPGLEVSNFGFAMLAGMLIGLVNYLLVTIVEK